MANISGGSIVWNLDVDDKGFTSGLTKASAEASAFDNKLTNLNFKGFASQASSAFGNIADSLGNVITKLAIVSVASTFSFGAATKAAFDQVRQVENASFALKAYEKDAGKVNQVLSELVSYARSDLGVLFQRQDLFDAASTLKVYGAETSKIVGYTKTLSKGVAIGKTTFQELSEVLGRVITEGKVTSDTFDVLARRGIKLPDSMRNATVSADQLFKALDKALPDELLTGRANTIDGVMIRLQSSFRDLGSAILGVDKDTSQFKKGGLGDAFLKSLDQLRQTLKDPAFKEILANLGKGIGTFVSEAIPKLVDAFKFIISNAETIGAVMVSVAAAFVAAKIAAIGFAIAAGVNPVTLIATAIIALISVLVFLQLKFDIFGRAFRALQPVIDPIIGAFGVLFKVLGEQLAPAFEFVRRNAEAFKNIGLVILAVIITPLVAALGALVIAFAVVVQILIAVAWAFKELYRLGQPVYNWFKDGTIDLYNTIVAYFTRIVNFFRELPGKIASFFSNPGGILYNAGVQLMDGFLRGIKDKFNDVKNTLSNLTKKLTEWKGPPSTDKKILMNNGQLVIQGFINGLESQYSNVRNSLSGLTTDIGVNEGSSLTASPVMSGGSSSGSGSVGGTTIYQNNNVYNQVDMEQNLRDLAWQLGN